MSICNVTLLKDDVPVLFLSSGYEPMYKTHWKRAISAVICGRAEVIEHHDSFEIFTSSGPIPFPTIVRYTSGILLGKLKKIQATPRVTKKNVWLRDSGRCQYCAKTVTLTDATIDHVLPKSRGGKNIWENVALSCEKCNQKKGSRLLENCDLNILKLPFRPKMDSLLLK